MVEVVALEEAEVVVAHVQAVAWEAVHDQAVAAVVERARQSEVLPRSAGRQHHQPDLRILVRGRHRRSPEAVRDLILGMETSAAADARHCSPERDPTSAPAQVRLDRVHHNCRVRGRERALVRGRVLDPELVRSLLDRPSYPIPGRVRALGIVQASIRESTIALVQDKELRIVLRNYPD